MSSTKKVIIPIILLFAFVYNANAQNRDYARSILDTLCSANYHGRGYVNQGEAKAAAFIANEFEQTGLEKFGDTYYQPFEVSVNTLPSQLELAINGNRLKVGIDYQVAPSSPATHATFKTFLLNNSVLSNWEKLQKKLLEKQDYFLIIDDKKLEALDKKSSKLIRQHIQKLAYESNIKLGGIALVSSQKLTWHTSQTQALRPYLNIKKAAFPDKTKMIKLDVDAQYYPKYSTQNVLGRLQGKSDSVIVLSAHYDHLGRMGADTYYPGANDNASGTALLLDLAQYYKNSVPEYTMVFMAFGAEELGLLGSSYFVTHPSFPLRKIKFMLNFDISGTGDDGIQVVNGSIFKSQFERLQNINTQQKLLKQVKIRGESCNSDHCPFYRKGVPAFFIYTLGGIQAYHDVYDKSETLPLTEYEDYFRLINLFIDGI